MATQSESSANFALYLLVVLVTSLTTQAQLSTVPQRYRNESNNNAPQEFRRREQHQRRKIGTVRRKMEDVLSMPIKSAAFDMSLPVAAIRPRMMSIPLQMQELPISNDFDMSIPLITSDVDLSIPMKELPPLPMEGIEVETHGDEFVRLENSNTSAGSSLILASFIAGISALVVGAAALFVKMRRVHGRQVEECQEIDDMQMRVVSFASDGDLQGREIVIS